MARRTPAVQDGHDHRDTRARVGPPLFSPLPLVHGTGTALVKLLPTADFDGRSIFLLLLAIAAAAAAAGCAEAGWFGCLPRVLHSTWCCTHFRAADQVSEPVLTIRFGIALTI